MMDDRPTKRIRRESSTGESPQICRELGLMRRRSDHESVSFVGSASGIHFVQSVYNAVANESPGQTLSNQSPDQEAVPGEDDQLPTESNTNDNKNLWRADEIEESRLDQRSITFEDLLSWSGSFWDNWHPAYPFLHAPTVLEWFQKIAVDGFANIEARLSVLELSIVRSVMSISLADRRQSGERLKIGKIPAILVFRSFNKAIESIQTTLVSPPDLEALQALVSVELFLITILRHNAASRLGGLIVRIVFQMGLHRCPARYATFTAQERDIRQRLFWTIYCIDRHICQSLGSPLTIRDDDIDVCYFDSELHKGDSDEGSNMDDRLALLNFLAKHGEIKGLILELCHKSINYRKTEHDRANLINGKIIKWANDIEQFLDNYPPDSLPFAKHHQTILTILKHECIIALDRPLLTSPQDPSYSNALQSCISASRSIIKLLNQSEKNSASLVLLWPSMTWAVWMSAFVMIFAAIKQEVPRQAAVRCANQSNEILRLLSLRGSVWPNACAAAIRDLSARLVQESGPQNTVNKPSVSNMEDSNSKISRQSLGNTSAIPYESSISVVTEQTNGGPAGGDFNPSNPEQDFLSSGPLFSNDMAFDFQNVDLFDGFDIPFYLGDDQYSAWMA